MWRQRLLDSVVGPEPAVASLPCQVDGQSRDSEGRCQRVGLCHHRDSPRLGRLLAICASRRLPQRDRGPDPCRFQRQGRARPAAPVDWANPSPSGLYPNKPHRGDSDRAQSVELLRGRAQPTVPGRCRKGTAVAVIRAACAGVGRATRRRPDGAPGRAWCRTCGRVRPGQRGGPSHRREGANRSRLYHMLARSYDGNRPDGTPPATSRVSRAGDSDVASRPRNVFVTLEERPASLKSLDSGGCDAVGRDRRTLSIERIENAHPGPNSVFTMISERGLRRFAG